MQPPKLTGSRIIRFGARAKPEPRAVPVVPWEAPAEEADAAPPVPKASVIIPPRLPPPAAELHGAARLQEVPPPDPEEEPETASPDDAADPEPISPPRQTGEEPEPTLAGTPTAPPLARPSAAILPPAGPEDPLTSTDRPRRIGLLTLAVTFLGFGGWAALAPLGSAVVAAGNLVVESSRQDVQHLDGGQVAQLFVREGSRVAAGDRLIALDPVRATAQASLLRTQMDAAQLLVARLRAEQAHADALVVPPDLLAREASDPTLTQAIKAQRSILEARRVSLSGQAAVLQQRIGQLREQMAGLTAQEQSRIRQIRLLQQELAGVMELLRSGNSTRIRALALERDIARLEGERGEHAANLARLGQAIGETELQILQLRRSFDEDVATRLQEGQQTLAEAQERLISAADLVRRLDIRAPVSGSVVGLAVFTVGAVLTPGQLLMQIVPAGDRLLVEAEIRVEDVERLAPGQQAIIQFTGLPQVSMPRVTGELLQISADRLTEQRTGQPFYRARLAVDEESRESLGERRIIPGMPVQVMIGTGHRTMLGYLLDPVTLAFGRAMRER